VIDTASGRLSDRIGPGESPEGIGLSRDGALRGAASELANGRSGTASVIDTVAGKRVADIPVGELPMGSGGPLASEQLILGCSISQELP
jgi:YVTN family beta-propeller protein